VQTERRTKQACLFFYSEVQPIFEFVSKIVQTERRTKQACLFFLPKCSLSSFYE